MESLLWVGFFFQTSLSSQCHHYDHSMMVKFPMVLMTFVVTKYAYSGQAYLREYIMIHCLIYKKNYLSVRYQYIETAIYCTHIDNYKIQLTLMLLSLACTVVNSMKFISNYNFSIT